MKAAADAAAARLNKGGRLLAGGDPSAVGELCGRAGGLMMIKGMRDSTPQKDDVVLFAPSRNGAVPRKVLDSGALLIVFGNEISSPGVLCFANHADEAGISPTLANVIPAWVFTGELVAALTRLGRMPVLYESIGLYGGVPRIYQYEQKGIFWHDKHEVPPIAAGVLGHRFIDAVADMLRRVEAEERKNINRAAGWAAAAKRSGKQLFMYSMGHIFPAEVEKTAIGQLFKSGVWNSGFSYLKPPDDACNAGDVLIHIGYQHPPTEMLRRARHSGARVVYVDVLRDRDYVHDRGVIWIDPMWPWSDACVGIEGYDVPALASSGIVNGAIAWEIYRVTQRSLVTPS